MSTDNRLTNLENKLIKLENQLDRIETILQNIQPSCDKMSTHINFVEDVYSNWKSPLSWILGKFSNQTIKSPEILTLESN